jgi:hypothetical protein
MCFLITHILPAMAAPTFDFCGNNSNNSTVKDGFCNYLYLSENFSAIFDVEAAELKEHLDRLNSKVVPEEPDNPPRSRITCRADLSFVERDSEGRSINWNIVHDRQEVWGENFVIGQGFMSEIAELSSSDETEAYNAVRFAIQGFISGGWGQECGFSEAVARCVIDGLRHRKSGQESFEPMEYDASEVANDE